MTTSPILGCGSSEEPEITAWVPPDAPQQETSISFEQNGALAVELREEHVLSVVVDPPRHQEVNFVLLGSPLDATLDQARAVVDDEGRARVTLHAPNQSTTFRVRTWIMQGPADEISVAAVGDGFAPVEIIPIYKGIRPITDWKASIVARSTCAEISPLLPLELPEAISGDAAAGEPLIVEKAPVGPSLAVTVRAGEFAWGCTDAHDLVVGETMKVKVNVIDKPIDVGATDLDVTFQLQPDPNVYSAMLEATSGLMVDAFVPKDVDPGVALLDAIASRIPDTSSIAFAEARLANDWDSLASTHLAQQPSSFVGTLRGWFSAGVMAEPLEVVTNLKALPSVPGAAMLSPVRFGSVPASDAGMPGTHLAKLRVEAGDVMHLGGSLYWLPSRYVGAVMQHEALFEAPEGTTMADVLSALAACDALGQTLGGFDTCDATCVAGLCHEALSSRWNDALDASANAGKLGLLNLAAVVTTAVDNTAIPTSFQGSWLGNISDGDLVAKISKAELSGVQPVTMPAP